MNSTDSKLCDLLENKPLAGYITPLFWQHGEDFSILLKEMTEMHSAGITSFILESRPFPGFLGEFWWETLEFILQEAQKRQMKVFVFDDSRFPSGFADGRIKAKHPEFLRWFLRENHIDVMGPRSGTSFKAGSWLENDEEKIVKAIAVKLNADANSFDAGSAVDITRLVDNNILYFDTPAGRWRIFILIKTRHGGETHTCDYLNFLEPAPTQCYLEEVYQPHYDHFAQYFGNTFAGFFSDEPRFGNAESYYATLGKMSMVIPFSDKLMDQLDQKWGNTFAPFLPCLWFDGGDITSKARQTYMDLVSRLYSENFTRQIGAWCRKHEVLYIGHLIEDNGAHARLGYGNGHFFRAVKGQSWSGVDTVLLQNLPEFKNGFFPNSFALQDSRFCHWGLAKLASSAGHINPEMGGITCCEIFGAYGWHEGLKLMKWMTDHFAVRGVNHFIPHAFSPKEFPDIDCPPHFYARNHNPQWRYFHIWSNYANRVCHLLSSGKHIASAATLYHAEAEWSGCDYHPFEMTVEALAKKQIDCDIVPMDILLEGAKIIDKQLVINQESYQVLIIPYCEYLAPQFFEKLQAMAQDGLSVFFTCDYPENLKARAAAGFLKASYEELADLLINSGVYDVKLSKDEADLRIYHYQNSWEDIYFLVNESSMHEIKNSIIFPISRKAFAYDPMTNQKFSFDGDIKLAPYQSIFVIFHKNAAMPREKLPALCNSFEMVQDLGLEFDIESATAEEYPEFSPCSKISRLGNITTPELLPDFSGTIRYSKEFSWDAPRDHQRYFIDSGEVYEVAELCLNDQKIGCAINPPYRFEITAYLKPGINRLQIDVTNTLGKARGDNRFDRCVAHEPSGLIGPVQIWQAIV